jgi:hypothetical protein
MWLRVFGQNQKIPSITVICETLLAAGFRVVPEVRGDDLGWTECHLSLAGVPIGLARYLTDEDELRDDLNAYAAELEAQIDIQPAAGPLMERVIQTRQLITIRRPLGHPNELAMESCCRIIADTLAKETDAIIQIDGQGWYEVDGQQIIREY